MRINKRQGAISLSERETAEWQRNDARIIEQVKRKALEVGASLMLFGSEGLLAMLFCMPGGDVMIDPVQPK